MEEQEMTQKVYQTYAPNKEDDTLWIAAHCQEHAEAVALERGYPSDVLEEIDVKPDEGGVDVWLDEGSEVEAVACSLCETKTPSLGTQRCDECWELETRIERQPEIARKILKAIS
jgi:hypothetical protein